MKIRLILLFLSIVQFSFAQVKFEREYDISTDEIPTKALEFTNKFYPELKLKWFGEESQDGKSVEAKSFKKGNKYSIEFNLNGELLDIEKKVKFNSIEVPTRLAINKLLRSGFDKYKIIKVQIQWSGEELAIEQFLLSQDSNSQVQVAYEIVLEGKKNKLSKPYEFLFSDKGELLEKKEIEYRNTTNLEF